MTASADDRLRDAADELYGVPGAEFTRRRTALATAARTGGDRDLAARIGALPKPSAAAALVDDLVRRGQEDLRRVLELGVALRAAQGRTDRNALQRLTVERRALLPQIAARAADRVAADGKRPGPGVLEEFQQTLGAALVDQAAADAVRSGRLTRALAADGLGPVDLAGAVAVPGDLPPMPSPKPETSSDAAAESDAERRREERRLAEARERARSARQHADELGTAARRSSDDAAAAEAAARDRDAEVGRRREELEEAQQRLREAERSADGAREAADRARAAARTATDRATEAEESAVAAERAAAAERAVDPGSGPAAPIRSGRPRRT